MTKIPQERIDKTRQLVKDGLSYAEIDRKLGLNRETTRYTAKTYNIPTNRISGHNTLSTKKVQRMYKMYDKKLTSTVIIKKLGISGTTLSKYLKLADYDSGRNNKITGNKHVLKKRFIRLYRAGYTLKKINERLGINSASNLAKAFGLSGCRKAVYTPELIVKAMQEVYNGKPKSQVAKKNGIEYKTLCRQLRTPPAKVTKYLKEKGIVLKPN